MLAQADKHSKFTILNCRPEEALAIVQPVLNMSVLVMGLDHSTKRDALLAAGEALQGAKRKLATLMEAKLGRPFWPERFNNLHVSTNPLMGGYFDLQFTETMPSKEGNVNTSYRVRLAGVSRETTLEKFTNFVRANNPSMRANVHDFAKELVKASGL